MQQEPTNDAAGSRSPERAGTGLQLREIPRASAPTASEFHLHYEQPGEPVVLAGLLESWPALSRWSPEYFEKRFGGCRVTAAVMDAAEVARDPHAGLHYVEEHLAECMRAVGAGPAGGRYVASPVEQFPDALRGDFAPLPYCGDAAWQRSKLWAGSAGMRSPLHRDLPHNLYAQVVGRKRFVLFAPGEADNLYPNSLFSTIPNGSRADALAPDYEKFPRLRRLRGLTCVLEPGDVLFLPSLWWHQTLAESVSISVNFWWARGRLAWLARGSELAKRILGLSR